MSKFIKPRDFVRRFAQAHFVKPTNAPDELIQELKDITNLLREGKTQQLIKKYDKEAGTNNLPENKRHYIGIANAYLQEGENLERAGLLLEEAMSFYKEQGELDKYAICCANHARVAYRMGNGYEAAMNWYRRSWQANPRCLTAWMNAFCHTSLERHEKKLENLVHEFLKIMPDFAEIPILRQFFYEDGQIGWARRQRIFHDSIMKKLNSEEDRND